MNASLTNLIVILGHKGMLGSAVLRYYQRSSYTTFTTDARFPSDEFCDFISKHDNDKTTIINCIGAIPQQTNDFIINLTIVDYLIRFTNKAKILFASTDCVFEGKKENTSRPELFSYSKNDEMDATSSYGKSKAFSDGLILKNKSPRFLAIRSSIIGFDKYSKSFLSWVLNNPINSKINGYFNHYWNGITTLEWAKVSRLIINNWMQMEMDYSNIIHVGCEYPLSKYDLINIIRDIFERKDLKVICDTTQTPSNKTLKLDLVRKPIEEQLNDLKKFYF